jgi:enoyl-[acyl-carrier protein] reductase III
MSHASFSLTGKRILVTGGTRGIGRAISAHFARAGAHVVAGFVRDDKAAESLEAELAAQDKTIQVCRGDLTTETGKQHVLETLAGGTLSALVHCAATGVHRPVEELTLRHWDFTFALNLRAFFELVQALLPQMAAGGTIVGVSSQGALQAIPNYALVGATKGGLEALCRHLAVELAPRDIRVNVLSPGSVMTDAWNAFPDQEARLQEMVARSPRGRLTSVEEVALAAHFLCSDASSGVTGHTLVVDGGQRIRA